MKTGIVTPLWERGICYTALYLYFALRERHETGLLAYVSNINNEPRLNVYGEFDAPGICVYPRTEITPEDLRRWLEPFDLVIFMEERLGNYLAVAKEAGKKVLNYICEPMSPKEKERADDFDLVISSNSVEGTEYFPLGINLGLFVPKERERKNGDKTRVFVPLGWGGDYDRKNERTIVSAISRVQCRSKTETLIHKHGNTGLIIDHSIRYLSKVSPLNGVVNRYGESDFCVYSPKWKRTNLVLMEAMACGLPVIACDKPFGGMVLDGINGLLCDVDKVERHDGVYTEAYVPDVHDLAVKIAELSEDIEMLERMGKNARSTAEDMFDWRKNKEAFLRLVEGV